MPDWHQIVQIWTSIDILCHTSLHDNTSLTLLVNSYLVVGINNNVRIYLIKIDEGYQCYVESTFISVNTSPINDIIE